MINFDDNCGTGEIPWINEQVWVPGEQLVGSGRSCVWLKALSQGNNIHLLVTGGQEHIGAVAVAQPRVGANPEVDLVELAGHREGPLAKECAAALAQTTGCSCVASVGIHVEHATAEEIHCIINNVRKGLSLMILEWENRKKVVSALQEQMAGWALEAGRMALVLFRRTGDLEFKYDREAVTKADRDIETMLRERIKNAYPDDLIVGEEYGGAGGTGASNAPNNQRVWYLDPVDGTLNYALGLPEFCTSITLMQGAEVLGACIHQPVSGDLFTAERNCGAFLNGQRMHVSDRKSLDEAVISTQLKKETRFVQDPALLQKIMTGSLKMRRMGAVALELAYVAAGFYDGLFGAFTGPLPMWDVGAGILLVEEAGGIVSNGQGSGFLPGDEEILACNPRIHAQMLARIIE